MTLTEKIIGALVITNLVCIGGLVWSLHQSSPTLGGFFSQSYAPAYSIGTSTPVATFQIASVATTSTTTLEIGASGRTKGTCTKLYRTDGSALYEFFAAGATAATYTTTPCATVTGF